MALRDFLTIEQMIYFCLLNQIVNIRRTCPVLEKGFFLCPIFLTICLFVIFHTSMTDWKFFAHIVWKPAVLAMKWSADTDNCIMKEIWSYTHTHSYLYTYTHAPCTHIHTRAHITMLIYQPYTNKAQSSGNLFSQPFQMCQLGDCSARCALIECLEQMACWIVASLPPHSHACLPSLPPSFFFPLFFVKAIPPPLKELNQEGAFTLINKI